jgi:4-diphosphocytidyl-2-C-methyl-D-erythritol kinase
VTRQGGWSAWPAPAKLNLFLRIVGRREDGYHLLQTVFRLLDWGDTVHLRTRSDGLIVRHGSDLEAIPEAVDLSLVAAHLLRNESKITKGADICVEKRIPVGGGFGGGSSNAATVLLALDALWGLSMGSDRLAALAAQLGADVPVFVRGKNAWAEGVGDVLTPLDLPAAWYLLVDPGVNAPTGDLFQDPQLTRNAAPATMSDFVLAQASQGPPLGNAFEPVLRRREPAVEAALAAMSRFGSAHLTGSGSGCFVEFADRESAEAAHAALPPGTNAWVAAGARRSPLLDVLEGRSEAG